MLEKFLSNIDWNKVRIKRYPNRIFLCGSSKDKSIRAVLRDNNSQNYKYIFAETAMNWPDAKAFSSDFLELEEYIAAAVKLIVIISESPGSFAEMGAFVSNTDINDRLLLITQEQYYKAHSFIRYGIIQHLQGSSIPPTPQICIIPDIKDENALFEFKEDIVKIVSESINSFPKKPTAKFEKDKPYSQVLLVREIIALATIIEDTRLRKIISIIIKRKRTRRFNEGISKILFVLEKLDLIEKHFQGNKIFYYSVDKELCLQYPTNILNISALQIQEQLRSELYKKDNNLNLLFRSIYLHNKIKQIYLSPSYKEDEESTTLMPLMYKVFFVPKKNGGLREIAQPNLLVKNLQRQLLPKLLQIFNVHSSAMAYIPGKNGIKANAEKHLHNKYFLKLDFKDFFHSIKAKDFNKFLQQHSISLPDRIHYLKTFFMFDKSINKKDTADVYKKLKNSSTDESLLELFTGEFCKHFRLSIGAPGSPALSNIIMYEFDKQIFDWCLIRQISYSRYADDLTFSSKHKEQLKDVVNAVKTILNKIPYLHLELNTQKTKSLSLKKRVTITGLNITPQNTISVGRVQKKKIRAMLFHCKNGTLELKEYPYLKGWISYIKSIEPLYYTSIKKSYPKELAKIEHFPFD